MSTENQVGDKTILQHSCLVITFAENTNNCAAYRNYDISSKLVYDW